MHRALARGGAGPAELTLLSHQSGRYTCANGAQVAGPLSRP